jgi:hypothetical protein
MWRFTLKRVHAQEQVELLRFAVGPQGLEGALDGPPELIGGGFREQVALVCIDNRQRKIPMVVPVLSRELADVYVGASQLAGYFGDRMQPVIGPHEVVFHSRKDSDRAHQHTKQETMQSGHPSSLQLTSMQL